MRVNHNLTASGNVVEDFTLSVNFDAGTTEDVTSLSFNPRQLTCSTTGFSGNGSSTALKSPLPRRVQVKKGFDITCTRVPLKAGTRQYDAARFTIGIGTKAYTIALPPDEVMSYASASATKSTLEQLRSDALTSAAKIAALSADLQAAQTSLQRARVSTVDVHFMSMGELPPGGMYHAVPIARGSFGYASEQAYRDARLSQTMMAVCGTQRVVGYRWIPELPRPGNCCGYNFYVFGCSKEGS